MGTGPEAVARFWSRVSKTEGCWLWQGFVHPDGYGMFVLRRGESDGQSSRAKRAHRFAWTAENGPIAPGLLVCHKCDVPLCVNPSHLFLGTDKDNCRDRDAKGHGLKGRKFGKRSANV